MEKPIKKTTIVYEVIDRIISMIQNDIIKPGDRLPGERQLSEMLQVSRTSVRAAIQHLSYNNILESKQGNGTFVREDVSFIKSLPNKSTTEHALRVNDAGTFMNRMECRIILEPVAARLAALYATPEQISELQAIVSRMAQYVDNSTGGYYIEDTNFHKTLAEASGNTYLAEIITNYCITAIHHLYAFGKIPNLEKSTLAHHKSIISAIERRDAADAEASMLKHILFSLQENAKYIYNSPKTLRAGVLGPGEAGTKTRKQGN